MYKILGADQREYGPASADQIRQWIAEGRASGQTLARLADGPWTPLSAFAEFKPYLARHIPPPLAAWSAGRLEQPQPRGDGMSRAGMIFGALTFLQCCPAFALFGLIFSVIGWSQAAGTPPNPRAKSLAIAGLVLSFLGIAIHLAMIKFGVWDRALDSVRGMGR